MLTLKQIAIGSLAVGGTDLTTPTVGANKVQVIQSIRFVNMHATAAVTLNLYVGQSGSEKQIAPKDLSLGVGQAYTDETEIVLQYNDRLKAVASGSGGPLDYVISGFERDQT